MASTATPNTSDLQAAWDAGYEAGCCFVANQSDPAVIARVEVFRFAAASRAEVGVAFNDGYETALGDAS